jgi:iron complex outermembrane recepter protein
VLTRGQGRVRGPGQLADEKSKNYEIGGKFRLANRVTFNVSAFYTDIRDLQASVTAGTCSSRIVFNVPKAQSHGIEAELFARPNANWDFGLSATWVDATLLSSVVSTSTANGVTTTTVVGGLADGNRLPTAPKFQAVGSIGFTMPLKQDRDFFSIVTVQYVGSSFSQFENEQPGFGEIGGAGTNAAGLRTYGGVPAGTVITFDPQLAGYSEVPRARDSYCSVSQGVEVFHAVVCVATR